MNHKTWWAVKHLNSRSSVSFPRYINRLEMWAHTLWTQIHLISQGNDFNTTKYCILHCNTSPSFVPNVWREITAIFIVGLCFWIVPQCKLRRSEPILVILFSPKSCQWRHNIRIHQTLSLRLCEHANEQWLTGEGFMYVKSSHRFGNWINGGNSKLHFYIVKLKAHIYVITLPFSI